MNSDNISAAAGAGVDAKSISSPGHYTLAHVELYPHNPPSDRKFWEIKDIVSKFEIMESINRSSIIVKMLIGDTNNLLETLRICGNEKIHIHIIQDILKPKIRKEIDIEVYISDIMNYAKPTTGSQSFEIQAISKEAFLSQTKTLNGPFDDSITGLIENICTSELVIEKKFIDNESPGGGLMKGIYPNLKPFKAIKWLIRNAYGSNHEPYFFWHSLKPYEGKNKPKFYISSYVDLINKDSVETFNNIPFFKKEERTSENFYNNQLRKIKKISSGLNISVFNDIAKGAYASKTCTVDLSKKTYKEKPFEYSKDSAVKINKFQPFYKDLVDGPALVDQNNSNKIYVSENANAFGDKKNYHAHTQENISVAQSMIVNSQHTRHTLTLAGNPDLYAGAMITLNLVKPMSFEMSEDENTKIDEYMSGKYLIETLRHNFDQKEFVTVIDIIKDSSKLDLNSAVPGK